ncbi:unnamed protein product [Ceutorhynchus assimilis]|uniref:Cytochrome P450 n=1 Tax=Ceutorhynchus assimilis TaxID=467358 RepID=A0A9N9MR01_9CUCU|nr:unnamed protein product [Ceutorhynchus assimilis]
MIWWLFSFAACCVANYLFLKHKHTYWTRRGIRQFNPDFFFGNGKEIFQGKVKLCNGFRKQYYDLKKENKQYGGVYLFYKPTFLPVHPEFIKQILTKDFEHFTSHGLFNHENDYINQHIFNVDGEKWKTLRSKLSPTFTSGKMKGVYAILYSLAERLEKKVGVYAKTGQPLEIKEHTACFGTDVIATCFFGLESDCLNVPESEFRKYGQLIFAPRTLRFIMETIFNWKLLGVLGHTFASKKITKFFIPLIKETVAYRKKNNVSRRDYMDLLIHLQNENQLDEKELIANTMVMYGAGHETSSTATTFLMYELAKNQDIQDKVREEILRICKRNPDGEITYDDLADMKYSEMCIYETLRRYSPAAEVPRQCTKTYTIPGTNSVIEKNTFVLIPVWLIHMDPEYYPNPEKFNPENFLPENKHSRQDFVFMPFGGGPRFCIGSKIALMHIKVNLIKQFRKYRFALNPKTPENITFESLSLTLRAKENIYLDVTPVL